LPPFDKACSLKNTDNLVGPQRGELFRHAVDSPERWL
jgi:hypothetical protein